MRHHYSRLISQTLTRFTKPCPRIEASLRNPNLIRKFSATAQEPKPAPSQQVSEIVDELSGLTLLEVSDLAEVLRKKMGIEEMPIMTVMMPGMSYAPGMGGAKGTGGGGAAKEEAKVEKTSFDLKIEGGFDAAAKIKIIKEVRACTDLGLKEAKDLVEKAPTLLKKGVTKEEAEKIIGKMKEVGAKVIMEFFSAIFAAMEIMEHRSFYMQIMTRATRLMSKEDQSGFSGDTENFAESAFYIFHKQLRRITSSM